MASEHLLRYGTNAEQKYFFGNGLENNYDKIVINANMVAFSPVALASFIVKSTTEQPFIIDPITHAFQHNQSFILGSDDEKIKKSISNLIIQYGDELKNLITGCIEDKNGKEILIPKKPLYPDDVDEQFIETFTANVLNYQKNISVEKKVDQYKEYIDYANEKEEDFDIEFKSKPEFLIAPYFYIDKTEWVEKNVALINKAKVIERDLPVYGQIVLSKKFIEKARENFDDSELKKAIIDRYIDSNADGFLLWIDNYVEHEEISENLDIYIKLLNEIKTRTSKKIYSLYGSYFSILLSNNDVGLLDGVCHGLEYGESRPVVPVGGGLPVPKFYLYPLHKRISYKEMLTILEILNISEYQIFKDKICSCSTCNAHLSEYKDFIENFQAVFGRVKKSTFKVNGRLVSREFATTETKDVSLRHYLEVKRKEFEDIREKNIQSLLGDLNTNYETFKNHFDNNSIEHLQEWKKSIEKFLLEKNIN